MCFAGCLSRNFEMTKEHLENAFGNNPDGAGFAFAKDGKLIVQKGFFTFTDFFDAWKDVDHSQVRIVHFRKSTSGTNSSENCHPFLVNDDLCFIHNGILDGFKPEKGEITSDTFNFNERILKPTIGKNGNAINESPHIRWMLSQSIGKSKLVFLNSNGSANIIKAEDGTYNHEKTFWASNYSHTWNSWKWVKGFYGGSAKTSTDYTKKNVSKWDGDTNVTAANNKDSLDIEYPDWITAVYDRYVEKEKLASNYTILDH